MTIRSWHTRAGFRARITLITRSAESGAGYPGTHTGALPAVSPTADVLNERLRRGVAQRWDRRQPDSVAIPRTDPRSSNDQIWSNWLAAWLRRETNRDYGCPADLAGHLRVGSPGGHGGGARLPILRLPGHDTPPVRPCDETNNGTSIVCASRRAWEKCSAAPPKWRRRRELRAPLASPGAHFGVRSSPVGRRTLQCRFPPARLPHPGGKCGLPLNSTSCLTDRRTCTAKQLAGASGFYLVFPYIQLWSPICTALDGGKKRNDDPIDGSSSVVCTRWWGVGIFSFPRVVPAGHLICSAKCGQDTGGAASPPVIWLSERQMSLA